jgi:hypothetical protein
MTAITCTAIVCMTTIVLAWRFNRTSGLIQRVDALERDRVTPANIADLTNRLQRVTDAVFKGNLIK